MKKILHVDSSVNLSDISIYFWITALGNQNKTLQVDEYINTDDVITLQALQLFIMAL